jgi:hypothetical protein
MLRNGRRELRCMVCHGRRTEQIDRGIKLVYIQVFYFYRVLTQYTKP